MTGKTTGAAAELGRILDQLGATADEVASVIRAEKIQGIRNTARFLNPVVRYVRSQIKVDAVGLDLTKGHALRLVFDRQTKEEIALPQAVMLFLDAFNRGQYPDLELPLDHAKPGKIV